FQFWHKRALLEPDLDLDEPAVDGPSDAAAQARANSFDNTLAVRGAQLDQELTAVKCALVVFADDRYVAVGGSGKSQVVGRRPEVVSAEHQARRLGASIALVPTEWQGFTFFHIGIAQVRQSCHKEVAIGEDDVVEVEVFRHATLLPI